MLPEKKNKFNYLSEKYEFPGGKVENNETMEEALKREIKEELDLNISIDRFFKTINYSYPDCGLTSWVALTKQNTSKIQWKSTIHFG